MNSYEWIKHSTINIIILAVCDELNKQNYAIRSGLWLTGPYITTTMTAMPTTGIATSGSLHNGSQIKKKTIRWKKKKRKSLNEPHSNSYPMYTARNWVSKMNNWQKLKEISSKNASIHFVFGIILQLTSNYIENRLGEEKYTRKLRTIICCCFSKSIIFHGRKNMFSKAYYFPSYHIPNAINTSAVLPRHRMLVCLALIFKSMRAW